MGPYSDIEKRLTEFLLSLNLHPFNVLFILQGKLLKISFYLKDEVEEFEDYYHYFSDKSGYQCFKDTNTVLLSGIILDDFLKRAREWETRQ